MKHTSHFAVYGVVLDQSQENVLLIKKMLGIYTGQWDLPGGSLDEGETLEEALKREIIEETSCQPVSVRQLFTDCVKVPFRDEKTGEEGLFRHTGVLYQVDVKGEPNAEGDGRDSGGAFWKPVRDVARMNVTPFVRSGLKKALELKL